MPAAGRLEKGKHTAMVMMLLCSHNSHRGRARSFSASVIGVYVLISRRRMSCEATAQLVVTRFLEQGHLSGEGEVGKGNGSKD